MIYQNVTPMAEALAVPTGLAVFGGVARACRYGVKSWRHFAGSIIVSGFTGVVVHLLLEDMDLSESMQAALVAASGYSGGAILDALSMRILQSVSGTEAVPPESTQKWDGAERRGTERRGLDSAGDNQDQSL